MNTNTQKHTFEKYCEQNFTHWYKIEEVGDVWRQLKLEEELVVGPKVFNFDLYK